jgi:hypothetical protein
MNLKLQVSFFQEEVDAIYENQAVGQNYQNVPEGHKVLHLPQGILAKRHMNDIVNGFKGEQALDPFGPDPEYDNRLDDNGI